MPIWLAFGSWGVLQVLYPRSTCLIFCWVCESETVAVNLSCGLPHGCACFIVGRGLRAGQCGMIIWRNVSTNVHVSYQCRYCTNHLKLFPSNHLKPFPSDFTLIYIYMCMGKIGGHVNDLGSVVRHLGIAPISRFGPLQLGIPSCRTQSRDWHATGIATWRPLRESWLALGLSCLSAATTARCLRNVFDGTLWHRDIYRCIKWYGIV